MSFLIASMKKSIHSKFELPMKFYGGIEVSLQLTFERTFHSHCTNSTTIVVVVPVRLLEPIVFMVFRGKFSVGVFMKGCPLTQPPEPVTMRRNRDYKAE